MFKFSNLILVFLIFTSCKSSTKNTAVIKEKQSLTTKNKYIYKEQDFIPIKEQQESISGYYVGEVEVVKNQSDLELSNNDTILICFDTVCDKKSYGYYALKGIKETFEGSYNNYIDTTNVDYKYDGIFEYIVLAKPTNSNEKIRELKFIIEIGIDYPNEVRDNSQHIRGSYLSFTNNKDSLEINFRLKKTFYLYNPFLKIPKNYDLE